MSSTTPDTTSSNDLGAAVNQNLTALGDVISQMAEDKSNNWSDEVRTLTDVEKELLAAREELETYRANVGSLDGIVAISRYARIGKYTAAMMGSRENWESSDMLADISTLWGQMDDRAIGGQSEEELAYWRKIADDLSIRHDGAEEGDVTDETNSAHVATYIPSEKYPNLFNVLCSCGESSFGASLIDSAEEGHARHVSNPTSNSYRDAEATARLYRADLIALALSAASTPTKELS
ncbi:MAG: hypothetical protein ABWX92_04385 [Mycetocola sp.]